jgi:hypothetical protein
MNRLALVSRVLVVAAIPFAVVMAAAGPAEAPILSRAQWKAAPAIEKRVPPIKTGKFDGKSVVSENQLPVRQRAVYLTVHHTATPVRANQSIETKLRNLQKLMQGGYWIAKKQIFLGDIPYHFFIAADGKIAEGRELKFAAYSNTVYKTPIEQHITIVLEGNFETHQPTDAQLSAVTGLLYTLARQHNVSLGNIGYHRRVAATTCPGKHMIALMPTILETLRKRGIT